MMHIFYFVDFRTLLTCIFETTSWILGGEIFDFYVCVKLPPNTLFEFTVVPRMSFVHCRCFVKSANIRTNVPTLEAVLGEPATPPHWLNTHSEYHSASENQLARFGAWKSKISTEMIQLVVSKIHVSKVRKLNNWKIWIMKFTKHPKLLKTVQWAWF